MVFRCLASLFKLKKRASHLRITKFWFYWFLWTEIRITKIKPISCSFSFSTKFIEFSWSSYELRHIRGYLLRLCLLVLLSEEVMIAIASDKISWSEILLGQQELISVKRQGSIECPGMTKLKINTYNCNFLNSKLNKSQLWQELARRVCWQQVKIILQLIFILSERREVISKLHENVFIHKISIKIFLRCVNNKGSEIAR
mgnify:CR=1 FL=1